MQKMYKQNSSVWLTSNTSDTDFNYTRAKPNYPNVATTFKYDKIFAYSLELQLKDKCKRRP